MFGAFLFLNYSLSKNKGGRLVTLTPFRDVESLKRSIAQSSGFMTTFLLQNILEIDSRHLSKENSAQIKTKHTPGNSG